MSDFKSSEEFFAALRKLINKLQNQGNFSAAQELRNGFSCLNGLTDGWARLMDSIDITIAANRDQIGPEEMAELHNLLKVIKKVVYRR